MSEVLEASASNSFLIVGLALGLMAIIWAIVGEITVFETVVIKPPRRALAIFGSALVVLAVIGVLSGGWASFTITTGTVSYPAIIALGILLISAVAATVSYLRRAEEKSETIQASKTTSVTAGEWAHSSVIKILFLAANPIDTSPLRLDEEIRSIDQALRQSEFRDRFDIEQYWATRVIDIQGYLLRHEPDIVHFSGHGSMSAGIILEGSSGASHAVSERALSQLFSILRDNIRCVVLNACYSEQQARAIAEHIDCVVGMSKAIGDVASISFASAFYQALGYGRDLQTAFELGCLQIDLENLDEQEAPKLLSTRSDPKEINFVDSE